MTNIHDEHYSYIAEWYDSRACLVRKYNLFYYPGDSSIEMYDFKNQRVFLKRSKIPGITNRDIYLGGIVNVYGRQLSLVEYGDKYTQQENSEKYEKTYGLIFGDGLDELGNILHMIESANLRTVNIKMVSMDNQTVNSKLYTGRAVGIEMRGPNAADRWLAIVDKHKCGLCFSPEVETILKTYPTTAELNNCSCAIIKPHSIKNGYFASIIQFIQNNNFKISALQMFHLNKANSAEFYDIYKGVLAQYSEMVEELANGPCVVLEIQFPGVSDIVNMFRSLCGPYDPEIALHLRPNTLRAKFGTNVIQNAIHCTDLPEDGVLENEYFFKILSR